MRCGWSGIASVNGATQRRSRRACLFVLDSPRAGNLTTVPKSWIAPSIIYRAQCPVVVMPTGAHAPRMRDRLLVAAGTAGRPGIRVAPTTL